MTAVVVIMGSGPRLHGGYRGSKEDVARMEAMRYDDEAYEAWKAAPASPCPSSLHVLNGYVNKGDSRDPWGRDYQFTCDVETREMVVVSAGEDGRLGTADDIGSDD